jgi:hypothetical protein
MLTKTNLFAGLALFTLAGAVRAETAPPPPAELKKTVDAFAGHWMFDGMVTVPGGAPTKMKMDMDCKKTALGKGVACAGKATIPGLGPWQGSFMVGYDTHGKQVHFMGLTSDEEVHDHRCTWKGESTLACDPLKGGMGGQPVTEDLVFTAGAKTLAFKSTTTLPDGGKIVFEGNGKRK